MTKIEGGWEVKDVRDIQTDAKVVVDQLNNVWYRGEVDVVLGKITEGGKFLPAPNRDLSPNLLRMISDIMENKKR